MATTSEIRLAHTLLNSWASRNDLDPKGVEVVRNLLPEPPKQKTVEELTKYVFSAWVSTHDNDWAGAEVNPDIPLEHWLAELHQQLKGLKDTPVSDAALPVGMRLADHEQYGRVITSPKPNRDGVYDLLVPRPKFETGADWEYAHECELTFVDAEPAKPSHPEFLQTGAEYQEAPQGTIVAKEDSLVVWVKKGDSWSSTDGDRRTESQFLWGIPRKVLRWGEHV